MILTRQNLHIVPLLGASVLHTFIEILSEETFWILCRAARNIASVYLLSIVAQVFKRSEDASDRAHSAWSAKNMWANQYLVKPQIVANMPPRTWLTKI